MIQNIYYTIAIIVYSLFLIQFIISLFGVDTDFDVDFDGTPDFTASDLISFKGLVHFLMGYSGYLCLTGDYTWYNQIIAVLIGVLFLVILYYCYKLMLKLQHHPTVQEGSDLVGARGIVQLKMDNCYFVGVQINGVTTQIRCISENSYSIGDIVLIKQYLKGNYYI